MKTRRTIKTVAVAVLLLIAAVLSLASCSDGRKEIVIYTSSEDFQIEYMQQRMDEEFPDLKITFEYKSSGNHAAVLKSAGKNAGCHISHDIEYAYASELAELGVFAKLDEVIDFSIYEEGVVESDYYAPELRNSGAIILNLDIIEEEGLDIPTSYEDLLDPQYEGWISMPNPTASGTGYMFLLSLVNAWGEDAAFDYFDDLSKNVSSFTTSGSGPVNALVMGEAAIGLGMTAQGVQQITDGANLDVVFFEEGAPSSTYGQAIISGYETDEDVVRVFQFLSTTLTEEKCERFYPEKIFKDKTFDIENYPTEIKYADMSGNTPERKEDLLARWAY